MIELTNLRNIREEIISVLDKEDVWTNIKNDFWEDNKNTSYSYKRKIHFGYDKEQQRFVYRKIISGTGSFSVPIEEHFIDSKLLFKSSIVINKGTKLSKMIFNNKEEESKEYFIKLLKREIKKQVIEINKQEILGFSQEDILVLVSQGVLEKTYLNQLGDDKLKILKPGYSLENSNKFHTDNHISIFNEVFEEYALEFKTLPKFATKKESIYFYETIINKYSLFIKENWFDYEYYEKNQIKENILKNLDDLFSSFTFFNKKIEDGLVDLFDSCVIDAEKNKNLWDDDILELLIAFPVVSKHCKENYIFVSNYDNYTKPLVSKFSSKVTKIYLENTNSFLKFDVYNFQTYYELIENDIEIFIPKGSKDLLKQLKSMSEATQKINTFSEKENESFVKFQKYLDFFIKNTKETDNIFNTNFYLKKIISLYN